MTKKFDAEISAARIIRLKYLSFEYIYIFLNDLLGLIKIEETTYKTQISILNLFLNI